MKRQFIRAGVWKVGPYAIRRKSNGMFGCCFEVKGKRFRSIQDAENECTRLIASSTGSTPALPVGDIHGGSIT